MAVLEISARQFRDRQKTIFDMADAGRQILIKRGRKQSYILTPVEEDDFVPSPELLARIERAEQQMREGKYVECKTYEESLKHLESL